MSAIRPDPTTDVAWAKSGQAVAVAVLEAVQAEIAATSKQLEKSQMMVDLMSHRMERLNSQMQVAHKNKVMMDMMHDVVMAQLGLT